MKTLVNRFYNRLDQIHIEERILPPLKDDEVEIKIHAAALNKADLLIAKGKPAMIKLMFGLRKPKIIYPGTDFAGEVTKIGHKVTQFKIGDSVFGDLSNAGFGAYAKMAHVKEQNIWHIPKGYTYIESSTLPMPMGTSIEALKQAKDIKDKKVLIYGGSGGVGRFLVQLSLYKQAKVDVVASKKHEDDLKKLGVLNIHDYKSSSFHLPNNYYDVIFAVNGYQPLKVYSKALVKHGYCIIIGGHGKQLFAAMIKAWFYKLFKKRNIFSVLAKPGQEVLKSITDLCNQTKIDVEIAKVYPLHEASQAYMDFDAHVYKGKYVIDMNL